MNIMAEKCKITARELLNRSTFADVIEETEVARFCGPQCW